MIDQPELHEANFHSTLEVLGGVSLILFTTPFCGGCKLYTAVLRALEDPPFRVFILDAGENPGLISELEIFHFPSLILYINGRYHSPINPAPKTECVLEAVEQARRDPPHEEP